MKYLPFKMWVPMWLLRPPVNTEFIFRLKLSISKQERVGVRSKGDAHVTTFGINHWNTEVKDWRLPLRGEIWVPRWRR